MGKFARQNRKEGWVKHRKPAVEWLRDLTRDMLTLPEPTVAESSVWYAGMVIKPTEFSQQLGQLQMSLQRANAPVVRQQTQRSGARSLTAEAVEERELKHAGS